MAWVNEYPLTPKTKPMKFPQSLSRQLGALAALGCLAAAPSAHATLFAYEGFNNNTVTGLPFPAPDNTSLPQVGVSGTGFTAFVQSNGNTNKSVYTTTGLEYPDSYTGSFTAVGGNGINAFDPANPGQNSMVRLNFTTDVAATVNASEKVYVSLLAIRTGEVTPDTGLSGTDPVGTYGNPYPRNAGVRFLSSPTANNNSSIGMIGTNGNDAGAYGWGAWGWKSVNGNTASSPVNTVAGTGMDGAVDFLVVEFDKLTNTVSYWVNPQADGTSDGYVSFVYVDGANLASMNFYGIGFEAGSQNASRAGGSWEFDEIRVADNWLEAAGFEMMAVPEPSTAALAAGALGLGLVALRRRRA